MSDPEQYALLASIPDWRKVLSNFHVCPFLAPDGLRYRTIEHAFQAAKIGLVSPAAAFRFAMDSGSELSRGDGAAAQAQRKMVLLPPDVLSRWDRESGRVMERLAEAKYSQCPDAAAALMATKRAVLNHFLGRRGGVARFTHLERLRQRLLADATMAELS